LNALEIDRRSSTQEPFEQRTSVESLTLNRSQHRRIALVITKREIDTSRQHPFDRPKGGHVDGVKDPSASKIRVAAIGESFDVAREILETGGVAGLQQLEGEVVVSRSAYVAFIHPHSPDGKLDMLPKLQRCRILNMQYASGVLVTGFRRCMDRQRSHRDDATCGNHAIHWRHSSSKVRDLLVGQHTISVRIGQHAQRPIRRSGVVQADTKCDDLFEGPCRSVGMDDAGLLGPRSPLSVLEPIPKWERRILMPDHKPVGGR
jgi:hypothetical protein